MKIKKEYLRILFFAILVAFVFSSCSSSRKTTMKPRKKKKCNCPTFSYQVMPINSHYIFIHQNG